MIFHFCECWETFPAEFLHTNTPLNHELQISLKYESISALFFKINVSFLESNLLPEFQQSCRVCSHLQGCFLICTCHQHYLKECVQMEEKI